MHNMFITFFFFYSTPHFCNVLSVVFGKGQLRGSMFPSESTSTEKSLLNESIQICDSSYATVSDSYRHGSCTLNRGRLGNFIPKTIVMTSDVLKATDSIPPLKKNF